MSIAEQFAAARRVIFDNIDRLGSRAQRANHELKNSLNRTAGQLYRQAKARQLKGIV